MDQNNMKRILYEAGAGEGGGGADVMSEAEFQKTIRRGVSAVIEEQRETRRAVAELKGSVQKCLEDTSRLDPEVKKAGEELTRVKNAMNDFDAVSKALEKTMRALKLNARSSFGDPIRRALDNSDELRFTLNAIARHLASLGKDGIKCDPAFSRHIEDTLSRQKALTGVDTSLGQATVPIETFNEIFDTLLEYGDYSTLNVMRIGMRTVVLPVATARPQFYWIGAQSALAEGGTITSGAFTGSQVLLIVQTLACLMYVSRELLADSTVDLAPYVMRQMIESEAQGMDAAAFIGNGNQDTTNAGYVGLFNAPLANTNLAANATAGNTSVGALQLEDFVNVLLTVSPIVLKRKARWWAHPQVIALASLIRDKMGRPLFQTFTEVPKAGLMSILGYEVIPTAIAPNVNGAGQPVFAFGDPQGVDIGLRADLEFATSADIGFPQNLMAYRALIRAGVKIKTVPASTTLKPVAVLQTAAQ